MNSFRLLIRSADRKCKTVMSTSVCNLPEIQWICGNRSYFDDWQLFRKHTTNCQTRTKDLCYKAAFDKRWYRSKTGINFHLILKKLLGLILQDFVKLKITKLLICQDKWLSLSEVCCFQI